MAVIFVARVASYWAAHNEIAIIDFHYRMCSLLDNFISMRLRAPRFKNFLNANLLDFLNLYNVCFVCFIFCLLQCFFFISSVIGFFLLKICVLGFKM